MSEIEQQGERPLLRLVHGGDPGPEALAALVVALSSGDRTTGRRPERRSGWADHGSLLRRPLDHGPGRWVAGARPAR